MKVGMFLRCVVVAVVCCTMMVGCKKGCKRRGGTGTNGDTVIGERVPGGGGSEGGLDDRSKFGGPQQPGMFQAVQFAYDSAAINPSEQSKLQAVADYLRGSGGAKLLVEGHCDERGTAEYNRALGERRALAAREALTGMGVDGGSIQTLSYGKDKPLDPGHDEAAWAKNRRADFVIIK